MLRVITNLGSKGNELTSKGLIPTCHPVHEEKVMRGSDILNRIMTREMRRNICNTTTGSH